MKKIHIQACMIALLFVVSCTPPVYKNIVIYPEDNSRLGPCEPSICISPKNQDIVVAGSVLSYVHVTTDGGQKWNTRKLRSPHGVYGDPCIIADTAGRFYYFHLANPGSSAFRNKGFLESIVVQVSEDDGASWSKGTAIGKNGDKDQDKEWAVYNPYRDEVYVSWTEFDKYGSHDLDCHSRIRFSASKDHGKTWTPAITLSYNEGNCIDGDQTTEGAVPAVGPNGNIYVAWAVDEKIYVNISKDGGQNWLMEESFVADQPGGWATDIPGLGRCNGMPVTVADVSQSNYRGRVYICWSDESAGSENDNIYICWSDDQGSSWSNPVLVNEDKNKRDQFFPWMSVDPVTGYIYIVYYDKEFQNGKLVDVTLAVSRDGGQSWKSSVISSNGFELPSKSVFFGDYNNISAYNKTIRPIWTHYSNGKLSVKTALIKEKK
jgi:photosystem II stability/assembly factor-like uncharacterized protein